MGLAEGELAAGAGVAASPLKLSPEARLRSAAPPPPLWRSASRPSPRLLFLLAAHLTHVASADSSWTRGAFDTTLAVTTAPFSYSVALRGSAWLSGGGAAAACNGVGRSTFNGTLVPAAGLTSCDGTDPRLGAFECVSLEITAADGDEDCALTLSFKYYAARDAFEFAANFAAGGVARTATAPQPNVGGWPAGPWPLSTAFPAFSNASSTLGFMNTRGNLLSNNFISTSSAFLSSYVGGLEGGPLCLFDASAAAAHPPALVLSPLTHAKSVFVAPWAGADAPPSPPPSGKSPAGVYQEVDHGQMQPLVCSVAPNGVVTFANGDARRDSCWITANCTLVAPSGPAACVSGNFFTADGSKFATQNWTASIAPDFSSVTTSEGSIWRRYRGPSYGSLGDGYIGAGNDLPGSGVMTLAAAEMACTADPLCLTLTFESASADCNAGACNIYLKSASDFTSAQGWQSYAKRTAIGAAGLAAGVSGIVAALPPGFEQRVLLVGRGGGISAAWAGWGAAMTAGMSPGRFTLDDDEYNAKTHYMTDNGALYCYCNDVTGTPMRETVAALIAYHKSIGVKPALYHFDPFWHSHHLSDGHCDGVTASAWNESEFHWAPNTPGGGLAALDVDVQVLFMLLAGPSKATDRPGGNVYDGDWPMIASDTQTLTPGSYDGVGGNAQVAASHSRAFWDAVFGALVRGSRLRALVTDTLFVWHQAFSPRLNDTAEQEQWLEGFYGAATALGLPVRVDQSNPSDHLASAEFGWPAFVSARCGGDQDGADTWLNMGSTGAFLAALQVRPIMDVLWTTETQPTRNGGSRPHIAHELAVATLTTGPVGIGDAVNCTNATLLRQATRADDVILKPAAAAVRLDGHYSIGGAAPFVGEVWGAASVPARAGGSARTDRRADSRAALSGAAGATADGLWWWTLLATQVDAPHAVAPSALWPPSAAGTQFVAAEFGRACANGSAASACLAAFGEGGDALNVSTQGAGAQGAAPRLWRLFSVAPVLPGGYVLVGEEAKLVRVSPQRLVADANAAPASGASDALNATAELGAGGGGLAFGVRGAPGEVVRLTLVAPMERGAAATASAALAGQVLLLDVELPPSGAARVQCRTGGGPVASSCGVEPAARAARAAPAGGAAPAGAAAAVGAAAAMGAPADAAAPLPTLVHVFIDDWGHHNVGFHARGTPSAAEVQTPTIDALAAAGVVLERAYAFRFCSPTRSSFLTGRNPVHVNVLNSPLATFNASDAIAGAAGIPRPMSALAQRLRDDAGYATIHAGKWHCGTATPTHTPIGRGFTQSLGYLDGANDHWTSQTGGWCGSEMVTDLFGGGPASGPSPNAPAYAANNSWACSQSNQAPGCTYSDDAYTAFAVAAIGAHSASAGPLFLYFAPHAAHQPLEVPQASLDRFAFMCANDTSAQCANRKLYAAMVSRADDHIAEIVGALKAAGLWESTLMTIWADNGGPIYGGSFQCELCDGDAGASNYPLRGGKHSNFEGGVRVNALVTGGLLPAAARGRVLDGLASVEDLFVTFATRAGIDPFDKSGAAAGLPPVDGLDLWPWLSGANATSPRTEVVLGACVGGAADGPTSVQGLIRADGYKLLVDELIDAVWQGPFYPNSTTNWKNTPVECGSGGCLFNVFLDPTEHDDLSAREPAVLAQMQARLRTLQLGVFSPHRGTQSELACNATVACRGFVCPFAP